MKFYTLYKVSYDGNGATLGNKPMDAIIYHYNDPATILDERTPKQTDKEQVTMLQIY